MQTKSEIVQESRPTTEIGSEFEFKIVENLALLKIECIFSNVTISDAFSHACNRFGIAVVQVIFFS